MNIFDTDSIIEDEVGTENIFTDVVKNYITDPIRNTVYGIEFTNTDLTYIKTEFPNKIKEIVQKISNSKICKENNIKATIPKQTPLQAYNTWKTTNEKVLRIPVVSYTNFSKFKALSMDRKNKVYQDELIEVDKILLQIHDNFKNNFKIVFDDKEKDLATLYAVSKKFRSKEYTGTESEEDKMFDMFNTDTIEYIDGTESIDSIKQFLKNIPKKVKHYLYESPKNSLLGYKFTQEDLTFIKDELPKISKELVDMVNTTDTFKNAGITAKASKMKPIDVYNVWVNLHDKRIQLPVATFYGTDSDFKLSTMLLKNIMKFKTVINKVPSRWGHSSYFVEQDDKGVILIFESSRFRTKRIEATESADDLAFVRLYESMSLVDSGLESVLNSFAYGDTIDNMVTEAIELSGGVENCLPVDLDFDDYEECVGTEGFLNVIARGWSRFRRVLHPLVRSTIKVGNTEYNNIKSVFNGAITRSIPALKQELATDRFLKFLMDNGALVINEKASDSFANDSRLIASVIISFKSSKIKYDEATGILTVGGKKTDIMELQSDESFSRASDASQVIYRGIQSAIVAINHTVNKQLKAEHILDKMGFSVKFLNDGKQTVHKKTKVSTGYTLNAERGIDSTSTTDYVIENVNEITTQLNNKDIKIGIVSRPLELSSTGTESEDHFLSLTDLISLQGGTEMASETTNLIAERMAAVENMKAKVMASEEYQRGIQAGIEGASTIPSATKQPLNVDGKSSEEVKKLLGKIYDKYGMDGLKDIVNE